MRIFAFALLALFLPNGLALAQDRLALYTLVPTPYTVGYMRPTHAFFEKARKEVCPTATSELFRTCCTERVNSISAEWSVFDAEALKPSRAAPPAVVAEERNELWRRYTDLDSRTEQLRIKFPSTCDRPTRK